MNVAKLLEFKNKHLTWIALGVTLAVALGAVLLLVEGFGEVAESVADHRGISQWDRAVTDWFVARRDSWPTGLIAWYSNTGGPLWQPIVTGAT